MAEENRSGLLAAISDFLKLLGLVVLVAEAVILAAMGLTPTAHPISAWYPIFMLGFLLVIVVGVFVDRYLGQKSAPTTIGVGDVEVTSDPDRRSVRPKTVEARSIEDYYIDMKNGFSFKRPPSDGWSGPEHLSVFELGKRIGIIKDTELTEDAFKQNSSVVPLGTMMTSSENVVFSYGNPMTVEFTDQTSNAVIDAIIERVKKKFEDEEGGNKEDIDEAALVEFRHQLLNPQGINFEQITIVNSFSLMILDKSLAEQSPVQPTLGNIFSQHQAFAREPIDDLVAYDGTMLWGTRSSHTNVLLNDNPCLSG